MLKTLTHLLQDLKKTTENGQIILAPGSDGGMAVVASWINAGKQYEVAQVYAPEQIEEATDAAVLESVRELCCDVQRDVDAQNAAKLADLTPQEMQSRLVAASRQAPKNSAADYLGKILGLNKEA